MQQDIERLDRNERRNSLAAFLRAIKFCAPQRQTHSATSGASAESRFAHPQPRARQRRPLAEESRWIRSAN